MFLLKNALLVSFFTLQLTWSILTSNVALNDEFQSRLIGAQEAERTQFPWQAEIKSTLDGVIQAYCAGSMISRDYIITSAECIHEGSKVEIALGAWNITNPTEAGRVNLVSDFYFIHPNFSAETLINNLAVVHLPKAISSSPYINPARLPPSSEANSTYLEDVIARLSGWGAYKNEGPYTDTLRYIDNEVIDLSYCIEYYGEEKVNENHICLRTSASRGPCFNDSGIPIAIENNQGDYYQIGISSIYDIEDCILGMPIVGTRLVNYLQWIHYVTGLPIN